MASGAPDAKGAVKSFWEEAACGEAAYLDDRSAGGFSVALAKRYDLEPYIPAFAAFEKHDGARVLEIGVGMGADHEMFARSGAKMTGVDLTRRAIGLVAERLAAAGLKSDLRVADAESLPFGDDTFDHVYSWGVIHHSPDTAKAAREILRVLKPGGTFAVMIYHRRSLTGLMLWVRYGLLAARPLTALDRIYAERLESPGTKAYSLDRARALFAGAQDLRTCIELAPADLLIGPGGQRHRGAALSLARILWPRRLLRVLCANLGLYLLISGRKADLAGR